MEYIIEGLLPARQVHIMAGASGSGKTDLLLQYLSEIQQSQPFFNHTVNPGNRIAYIGTDRPIEEYEEKFILRSIPKNFPICSVVTQSDFRPRDIAQPHKRIPTLKRLVDGLRATDPTVSVIVLDPLSTFLPSKLGDYHLVADALIEMTRFCADENLTILGTHHATKLKPDTAFKRPQDRILGSAALLGYSGTHMFLTSPEESPDDDFYTLTLVPHNYPPESYKLLRDPLGRFQIVTAADAVAREASKSPDFLPIPHAPDSIHIDDIAKSLPHLSRATIYRHTQKLLDSGIVASPQRGYFQRLDQKPLD